MFRWWASLSRQRRLAFMAAAVVLAATLAYVVIAPGSATLKLSGRHKFRNAEISLWIDGDHAYSGELTGSVRKQFGVFGKGILGKVEGTFSKSLRAPAGEHRVQVRVRAASEGYDQTRSCEARMASGNETTLVINAERGRELFLAAQSPAPLGGGERTPWYATYATSIFMTISGSAISATIGFFIQEFLRSRKSSEPIAVREHRPEAAS